MDDCTCSPIQYIQYCRTIVSSLLDPVDGFLPRESPGEPPNLAETRNDVHCHSVTYRAFHCGATWLSPIHRPSPLHRDHKSNLNKSSKQSSQPKGKIRKRCLSPSQRITPRPTSPPPARLHRILPRPSRHKSQRLSPQRRSI
jgi:hypothetical protein